MSWKWKSTKKHNNASRAVCRRGHKFTKKNTKIDPRGYRVCLTCRRAWWVKRLYNVTPETRAKEMKRIKGLCAICKKNPATCTDHDHKTKRFRGILCVKCNFALGLFNDSIKVLKSAIGYLARLRED